MTIRVVLADDQALIRAGFHALIDSADDLQVVGQAGNGCDAIKLVRDARADVVLMDIRMPVMDGLAATKAITGDDSLAGVRVLILTTFEMDENVLLALRAGASGFLNKGVDPTDLLAGIRTVAAGEALLSPGATRSLINRFLSEPDPPQPVPATALDVLTDREREVLTLVASGLSNQDIANRLYVSPLTAKTHVNRAMTKLRVRGRAQLVILAYETGLIRPGSTPAN
ncbi:response regulator transcription factor [Streptomyces pseudovenezuelae]|uniref:DNA-binding NarL/FixJ family response regulator n=1 Tax=Streptomyces pseudovenezuelae TaxID=67350 RepID=A0ABT6LZ78_9ACTN|nr:response regulator transcription factor [Streptomyces pseudovenezuelae]MDH6221612.1 DNA-binding NarL/FixJ family response regulator [Streptomyces pseudovenezuelae]